MDTPDLKPKRKNDEKPKGHPRRWLAVAFLGMAFLAGIGLYIALHPNPILYPQYPAARLVYTTGTDKKRYSINLQTNKVGYIDEPAPEHRSPRLSPDGQWRVLWQPAEAEDEWNLILESMTTDRPARVLGQFFYPSGSPAWSSDSQWIVFSAAIEMITPDSLSWMIQELWLVKIESGELKRLTENYGVQELSPSFAPDGNRLAYISNSCGSLCLYIMDLATGESELILYETGRMVGNPAWWPTSSDPAWSPDGEWIAVVAHEPNDKYTVWITRPDGSGAHIIGGYGSYAADPEWRPE